MSSDKRLLLIGGGGHCRSVLDCALSIGSFKQIGIVDKNLSTSALQASVIGNDNDLPRLFNDGWTDAFISVGSIGNTDIRRELYQKIKEIGFIVPIITDPTAIISKFAEIDEGVFIGKRTVVNAGAKIGKCAILNTGSIIEHDCMIGDFSHISPGAVLCGNVYIGADSHIGACSVVRQEIHVGTKTLIGMGSVVTKDIPNDVTAFGNPCTVVK